MCFTYQNTLSASFKFSKIVKHKRPSSSLPLLPCGCCQLHVGGWACVSLCKCTNWYRAWRQREESLSPIHKANTHPSHGHFFAQNQQKCWQINQLGIFCKVRDVSVILLIPCSCETTSQPLARRVILRQVFFFSPSPSTQWNMNRSGGDSWQLSTNSTASRHHRSISPISEAQLC